MKVPAKIITFLCYAAAAGLVLVPSALATPPDAPHTSVDTPADTPIPTQGSSPSDALPPAINPDLVIRTGGPTSLEIRSDVVGEVEGRVPSSDEIGSAFKATFRSLPLPAPVAPAPAPAGIQVDVKEHKDENGTVVQRTTTWTEPDGTKVTIDEWPKDGNALVERDGPEGHTLTEYADGPLQPPTGQKTDPEGNGFDDDPWRPPPNPAGPY